jgi:predicted nucleic acid-binding protein
MKAVDTNVLIYAVDAADPIKQERAGAILSQLSNDREDCRIVWQVAAEFLSFLRKWMAAGRLTLPELRDCHFHVLNLFPLAIPTVAVFDLSLDLSSRYSLSHWDSLLVAACIEAGIDTLYSEDMSDGAVYDSVTIVNPLKPPDEAG